MSAESVFDLLWEDYIKMTPQAQKIVKLFEARGENVINDHIALRTINQGHLGVDSLAKIFTKLGYQEAGSYVFEEKKLFAKHYEHQNEALPKVFISELLVEKFSEDVQGIMQRILEHVSEDQVLTPEFLCSGTHWQLSIEEYETLAKESEYAAWLSAIGYRPNHFTVYINKLKSFDEVSEVNDFLKEQGMKLNSSGGEIKGNPQVLLEQSSTLADEIQVNFVDGSKRIPSCYFEFAKRYQDETGKLYQGFVAASADKIFESTDKS